MGDQCPCSPGVHEFSGPIWSLEVREGHASPFLDYHAVYEALDLHRGVGGVGCS